MIIKLIDKYLNEENPYKDYVKTLKKQGYEIVGYKANDKGIEYTILQKNNKQIAVYQDDWGMDSISSPNEIKKMHTVKSHT